jgi:dTDP-4-dehydrorhamnose reductase
MRILLFGVSGQLGYEVITRARALHFEVVAPVESELDIGDSEQVKFLAKKVHPELIVNCAAYTSVDKAEQDRDPAYRVNRDGVQHLALAAKELKCRVIHISTDYIFDGTVFDGQRQAAITEDTPPNPLNVYGQSKLAGEQALREIIPQQSLILRTSSLHGQKGVNFVHTMLRLFGERQSLKVVNDQFMCPTWAGWLAEVILDLARMECCGVLNACGRGVVSWHGFAQAILERAKPRLKHEVQIEPISWREYPVAARRPEYSALDCGKLTKLLGREPITWQQGLIRHMTEIGY